MAKIDYLRLLHEVLEGRSRLKAGNDFIYFKHPTVRDTIAESAENERFEEQAEKIGLKSSEELLEIALASGRWTEEKESDLEDLLFSIESSQKVLNKVKDARMKEGLIEKIKRETEQFEQIEKEKNSLVMGSKERYVMERKAKLYFKKKFFIDEGLETPCDEKTRDLAIPAFNEKMGDLNKEENMLWAAYSPSFFELFLIYKKSPDKILDITGLELTIFQKKIIAYGSILMNKISSGSLPDHIRGNPVSIYKWTGSNEPVDEEEDFDIRKKAEKHGGLENMKPEDKIT